MANDGRKIKKQKNRGKECFKEVTGDQIPFSLIRLEYEDKSLQVKVYDHETKEYVHCFTQ